jgi:putative RecB family exonuclease
MTVTLETGQSAETAATERTSAAETAPRRPSLSPSRAADFKSCPLLYRFRTIDRLPEKKSRAAVRGTLVHAVLEKLYDLPAAERTVEAAQTLLAPAWAELREEPGIAELFEAAPEAATPDGETALDRESLDAWLASAGELVETYFRLEDPTRIQPHGREELVEVTLPDGLLLRGYVDRLDVAPTGALRVVDYKTGGVPREAFEAKALFQMKFYALVLWRTRGVVAAQLKLLYLKDGDALTYAPDEAGPTRAGSAAGATTRRSARPSGALPRRSRPTPPRPPVGGPPSRSPPPTEGLTRPTPGRFGCCGPRRPAARPPIGVVVDPHQPPGVSTLPVPGPGEP